MGIELIRKAVCDRCGKECSHIKETILHEDVCKEYDIKTKQISQNVFRYTEITLQSFDTNFEGKKDNIILCGECVDSLGEWLKNNDVG